LKAPAQALLEIGNVGLLKELSGKVRKRRAGGRGASRRGPKGPKAGAR
jgi:hypothetical protein